MIFERGHLDASFIVLVLAYFSWGQLSLNPKGEPKLDRAPFASGVQ